jgi:hypothetical protein
VPDIGQAATEPGPGGRGPAPAGGVRRPRWLDAGLILLVGGIAVAAVVHVVRTGGEGTAAPATTAAETSPAETTADEPRPLPAILPLPGELREAGGILWWSDASCEARAVGLSSGAVSRLPAEHCRIWPAPSGNVVVATATSRSDALDGRGLVQFSYPAPEGQQVLGGRLVLTHEPGIIASELAWPVDEQRALACIATQEGTIVAAVAADASGEVEERDACFPAVLPDGRTAFVQGRATIVLDGQPLLSDEDLELLLPNVPRRAERVVSALAAGDEELVVGLAVVSQQRLLPSSAALAIVSVDGDIRFSAHLPADVLPAAVGLSPRGDALWYFDAADGTAHVITTPGGREQPPYGARWVAWSPDGDYVVLARERSLAILTWPDGFEVERIPAAAGMVAWTRAPGG